MKIVGLAALLLMFVACSPRTPEGVARSYLSALENHQFDQASAWVTPDARSVLLSIKSFYQRLSPEERAKFDVRHWHIEGVDQNGDSAEVEFSYDSSPQGGQRLRARLWLLRTKGIWLVDLMPPL